MALHDVGLVGLGVMGRNLALNLADHGYSVAGYDVGGDSIGGVNSLDELVAALGAPRIVIVLVPAGAPVDEVCKGLLDAGLQPDDIVVDCGNSLFTDTIRREREHRGRMSFFGSGISGGEVGARFGPSLMPGGDPEAWQRLKPIWEAIAAKVDPESGRPIEGAAPGKPIPGGEPCTAYMGTDGAGHYVKMVHNGIEYADMQLIAEAYHLLRGLAGMEPAAIGEVFAEFNRGELESYLVEITADILGQADPVTGKPLVDVVLDRAGMKGTGTWTAINALELGTPATSIAEAVFARAMSADKDGRVAASEILQGPVSPTAATPDELVPAVRDALYCSKICAYAQGFALMQAAQHEYGWSLDLGEIARIWRGGCIIRAVFLQKITDAYHREAGLANLLLDPHFAGEVQRRQTAWRDVVARAAVAGVPCPAFSSSLAYYDAYRTATLPASLLQAQRDYFGAHTFERTDRPRGEYFHVDWPASERTFVEA